MILCTVSKVLKEKACSRLYSTLNDTAFKKLSALRSTLTHVDALIIPSEDAHQSEYTAECDNRRAWISEFTGSAGCAIVTKESAALFTDGRYFLQASKELDSRYWTLMKQGMPGVPTWQEYLTRYLPAKSRIGVDASVISLQNLRQLEQQLTSVGSQLILLDKNPVDQIRKQQEESIVTRPSNPIKLHPLKYAGQTVESKLTQIRQCLKAAKTGCIQSSPSLIVAALDEIAWIFNLRGSDIHCCPTFFAYAVITDTEGVLYLQRPAIERLSSEVKHHLQQANVRWQPYERIVHDLSTIFSKQSFLLDSTKVNMSIIQAIGRDRVVEMSLPSFISKYKSIKNDAELHGARECHKRDAVALCKHFAWLDHSLNKEKPSSSCLGDITEFEAAQHLESMRRLEPTYIGPSFDTISATGPNASMIHYSTATKRSTSTVIDPQQIYLCDSGGHYVDGTTDVTRTWLFQGQASEFQKRAYTRVLQSHIALDQAIFPKGTTGYQLDTVSRLPLWKDGLDFRHGVGHGIGAYLNVHEGPHGIGKHLTYNEVALEPGMLVTNEPGFYKDGEFGIRIENVLVTRQINPYAFGKHIRQEQEYLGFEHVTFVPIDRNLLNTNLLNEAEKSWLNAYHQQCRDVLESLLEYDSQTLRWLERKTEPPL